MTTPICGQDRNTYNQQPACSPRMPTTVWSGLWARAVNKRGRGAAFSQSGYKVTAVQPRKRCLLQADMAFLGNQLPFDAISTGTQLKVDVHSSTVGELQLQILCPDLEVIDMSGGGTCALGEGDHYLRARLCAAQCARTVISYSHEDIAAHNLPRMYPGRCTVTPLRGGRALFLFYDSARRSFACPACRRTGTLSSMLAHVGEQPLADQSVYWVTHKQVITSYDCRLQPSHLSGWRNTFLRESRRRTAPIAWEHLPCVSAYAVKSRLRRMTWRKRQRWATTGKGNGEQCRRATAGGTEAGQIV